MAELQRSLDPGSSERVMGADDLPGENSPMFCAPDDIPGDAILINPRTPPLPDLHLWTDKPRSQEESTSKADLASTVECQGSMVAAERGFLFEDEAPPSVQPNTHACPLCGKTLASANALNKHLLTHQPDRLHVCSICQRAFKRADHLTGHKLTHQKRRSFDCTQPGCQKSYSDAHALKRHCVAQHGLNLTASAPLTTQAHTAQSSTSQWEPPDAASCLEGDTGYLPNFVSPPKHTSFTQLQGPTYQDLSASYSSYAGFPHPTGSMGLGCYTDDTPPPPFPVIQEMGLGCYADGTQPPPFPFIQETWPIEVAKDSSAPGSTGDLPTSQGVGPSMQWPSSLDLDPSSMGSDPMVALQDPAVKVLASHSWESSLGFPVPNPQTAWSEEILALQQSREQGSSGMDYTVKPSPPEGLVQTRQHRPILLKHSIQRDKPKPKPQLPPNSLAVGGGNSVCPKPSASFAFLAQSSLHGAARCKPPSPPPLLPPSPRCPSVTENKKKKEKRKTKKADVPSPPLPAPQLTLMSHRRTRPRPANLVSPSQVALASFTMDSTPCPSDKAGSVTAWYTARDGRESTDRANSRYLSDCSAQPGSSISQAPAVPPANTEPHPSEIPISAQAVPLQQVVDMFQQELQEPLCDLERAQLSPLLLPVSVPVCGKDKPCMETSGFSRRASTTSQLAVEKLQPSLKGPSKRPRPLGALKTLIIPRSPPPLLMPSPRCAPSPGELTRPWPQPAGGYPSHLRSPVYLADDLLTLSLQAPPYTPPPMLSPLRPGTGLYFNAFPQKLPRPPPPAIHTTLLDGKDGISLVMDDTIINIEPKINIGTRFQADVPPVRNLLLLLYEEHPAELVWAPWGGLSSNTDTQQRVTELLDVCCSSVLPGGGTNTELALHCLHEVQGDVLAALDLLLIRGDYRISAHPLSDYHYTGSDRWTAQERTLIRKALLTHGKDFQRIHRELQTKSVPQCVEYYYAMKKLKQLKQRSRGHDQKEGVGSDSMKSPSGLGESGGAQRGTRRTLAQQKGTQESPTRVGCTTEYACGECGRSFMKVKSRSAHMKSHR